MSHTEQGSRVVKFAERDGKLVHVDDPSVKLGAKCGCVCPNPACHAPMVAKKKAFETRKQTTYFAHASGTDCGRAAESALHRMAKAVLLEDRVAFTPEFSDPDLPDPFVFVPATTVRFERVEAEVPYPTFRPDIVGYTRGRELLIEIRVTHEVDDEKAADIAQQGAATIEIDLRPLLRDKPDFTAEDIRDAMARREHTRWIHNPRGLKLKEQLLALALSPKECPAGMGVVTPQPKGIEFKAPCNCCPSCIAEPYGAKPWCVGENRIDSAKALRAHMSGERPPEPSFFWQMRTERLRYQSAARELQRAEQEQSRRFRAAEATLRREYIASGYADHAPEILRTEGERLATAGIGRILFAKPVSERITAERQDKFLLMHGLRQIKGVGWCVISTSGTPHISEIFRDSRSRWLLVREMTPGGELCPIEGDLPDPA